jgi:predicted  nucleic acid-binding Zn-ribbon protein
MRNIIKDLKKEVEEYKTRLEISPFGDDKVDELEEACDNLRFQNEKLQEEIKILRENLSENQDLAEKSLNAYEKIYNQEEDDIKRVIETLKNHLK